MILGGMLEADHRMRLHNNRISLERRIMQNRAKWDRYEEEANGKDGK